MHPVKMLDLFFDSSKYTKSVKIVDHFLNMN